MSRDLDHDGLLDEDDEDHSEGVFQEDDFNTDEVSGLEAYTFADEVKKILSSIGLTDMEAPILQEEHEGIFSGLKPGQYFDGRLPTVIRRLSLDQLSALMSLYCNWYAYLQSKTQFAAIDKAEAKKQQEFILASIRTQRAIDPVTKKKRTDTAIRQIAETDFRFVEPTSRVVKLPALHSYLEAAVKVASLDLKVISREVTIQQTKLEYGNPFKGGRSPSSSPGWGGGSGGQKAESKEPPRRGRGIARRGR